MLEIFHKKTLKIKIPKITVQITCKIQQGSRTDGMGKMGFFYQDTVKKWNKVKYGKILESIF